MELSTFALWLAVGLAWSLALTPAAEVNPGYFRSSALVVLGLAVVSVVTGWTGTTVGDRVIGMGLAGAAYAVFVVWMTERVRLGTLALGGLAVLGLVALGQRCSAVESTAGLANFTNAATGSLLLGVSMGAMLLGHYYLTAPWMSLRPLHRLVMLILLASVLRGASAAVGLAGLTPELSSTHVMGQAEWGFYWGLRWVMGIAGPILLAVMVWQTLKHKATQAATGILYVIVIFTLIGETTAVAIQRLAGTIL